MPRFTATQPHIQSKNPTQLSQSHDPKYGQTAQRHFAFRSLARRTMPTAIRSKVYSLADKNKTHAISPSKANARPSKTKTKGIQSVSKAQVEVQCPTNRCNPREQLFRVQCNMALSLAAGASCSLAKTRYSSGYPKSSINEFDTLTRPLSSAVPSYRLGSATLALSSVRSIVPSASE